MRLTRLILGRYGHLSDVELTFPAEPGLHIVLGENEAGKSTALSAIGDCLFGFPHRTEFDFLHNTRDLRIGVSVQAADGREAIFFRRKGRKDDLLDGNDQPLPESALAAFLSGATRERFDRVFGLDGTELRRGGEAILKGEGDVGESIMQAHTGLHGFRALVDRLDNDARGLFGDRRGERKLHIAVDAYKAAKHQLDERTVEPAEYRLARDESDRLEQARTANRQEADALRAERARLDRIRRTAPARRALLRAIDEQQALGEVPELPPDAATQRQAALAVRERAEHDLARERARETDVRETLGALVVDETLLAEADAIDRLASDQSRIIAAENDRATQRIIADQRQQKAEQTGRRLGLALPAEELATRIPDALGRDRATRAIGVHVRITERIATARETHETAVAALADAQASVAAMVEPLSSAELRSAIDVAKAEGRIDAARSDAVGARDAARAALADAVAALPSWRDGADALAALPVPLDAVTARHAEALHAARAAAQERQAAVAARDAALAEIAADLEAATAGGDLPTQDAIRAVRERRDRAWRAIRRLLDGGASGEDAGETNPDAFEALQRDADALVDRRMTDQERVVAFEQNRARQAREQALRATAQADLTQALAASETAAAAWDAMWTPLGVAPMDPPAMQEWLRRRAVVLELRQRADQAARASAAVEARYATAWAALATLLPQDSEAAGGDVAKLLRAAERICREREAKEAAVVKAHAAVDTAQASVTKAERAVVRLETDLVAWRADWALVCAALALPPDLPVAGGEQALQLWNDIDKDVRDWRDAIDRIAAMTVSIDAFVAESSTVASRVAADLADADPHDAVRAMAARLATARAARTQRDTLTAEHAQLLNTIETLTRDAADADATLAGLRTLAGAEDDAALATVIARAAAYRALAQHIDERSAELRPLDDGLTLAELEQEADGVDPDTLPARIAAIDDRLRIITDEDLASTSRLTELRATLREMEQGHDAAGAAQEMQDSLAAIDDISARYVRLRLAHTLLRTGIDRFRRQQQGPLLGRAGAIFGRLTEGRYDRLGVEEADDGKVSMVAFCPDGSECPADRLSEGTRDQLYLALRLAAIESYAVRTEPLPFIADDLLVNFDDRRAMAAIRVLADFGTVTQTILFTHHAHIADLARSENACVHSLPARVARLVA